MQLFSLAPKYYDDRYAKAIVRGGIVAQRPCRECGTVPVKHISPLTIEWTVDECETGSDVIADFTWPSGLGVAVVSDRVRNLVQHRLSGAEFGPVEMVQDPKIKRPKRVTARTKRRVWLPYDGPPLWDLIVKSTCHLKIEESKRERVSKCGTCGTERLRVLPGAQVVLDASTWNGVDVFKVTEVGAPFFCTSKLRELAQLEQWTNLVVDERGVIPGSDEI